MKTALKKRLFKLITSLSAPVPQWTFMDYLSYRLIMLRIRFWMIVGDITRLSAVFFTDLHKSTTSRIEKASDNPQIRELLLKMLADKDWFSQTTNQRLPPSHFVLRPDRSPRE